MRLEQIGKRFAEGAPVLDGVSLSLAAGEFAVVSGAAGAGKTTLCKLIALSETPSEGRLRLFDADPARLRRDERAALRRQIGLLCHDLRLIERLSVQENVALPLRIAGAPAARIARNVGELLAWMGLAAAGERPAAALSGGERRLVALARAIVARPRLLLADEPAGDLDEEMLPLVQRVFEQVNRLGAAVLVLTSGDFAPAVACRRYRLAEGRLWPADA